MLLSSIPSHRLLSAALLISSSAMQSSLTTSALQMDSAVTDSAARRSWIAVIALKACMCRVYGCVYVRTNKRAKIRMHECFLAATLCLVGVFSKTVCGVKSHCGSRMENADMQPASFSNTTHKDSGGPEENLSSISPSYQEGRGKVSKGITKETELCMHPVLDGKRKKTVVWSAQVL